MSGLLTFVLPEDLRAAKRRVDATVQLVAGVVSATPSLDEGTRRGWLAFEEAWRAFVARSDDESTASQYDDVDAFVRKVRTWQSLLSSQCFGVPSPAPKRVIPLLPTWVTPSLVTTEKERVGRRVGALAARVRSVGPVSSAFAAAWASFVEGWAAFVREPDAWTHAAAQYDGVQAYEDAMPEWEEAFELAQRVPLSAPTRVTSASNEPSVLSASPRAASSRPAAGAGGFGLAAAAVFVVGMAIARGGGRR